MILDRITVEGFSNIRKSTIDFDDIISIIALNSYGKSNFLNAIKLGLDFITKGSDIRSNILHFTPGIPANINIDDTDYYFCLEGRTKWREETIFVKYEYSFVWSTESKEGYVKLERLAIKAEGKRTQYKDYILRIGDTANRRSSLTGRCDYKILIKPTELVINKLLAFDDLFYLEVIEDINNLHYVFDRHLDPTFPYMNPFLVASGDPLLPEHVDDDLNRSLYVLRRDYQSQYNLLIDSFLLLFPNIEKVEIFETDPKPLSELDNESENVSAVQLSIKDSNRFKMPDKEYSTFIFEKNLKTPILSSKLSDGTKRILLFLVYLVIAEMKNWTLLAFEEAENSIHPSLLQSFLGIISQLSGNCRVMITSHSPYLIQYLDPSRVYIGVPNNDGLASFKRINGKCKTLLLKDSAKYGITMADYVFILLGGVEDDHRKLKEYLECNNE